MRRFRATIVAAESSKYYVFWVCVSEALVIQHAMGMRHIAICGLSGSTILFHILIKGKIFGKKVIEHKMCVSIFSTACV